MSKRNLGRISWLFSCLGLGAVAYASIQPTEEPLLFPPRPEGPLDLRPESMARDIATLGDEDPAARGAAEARLFWAGEAARDSLRRAAKGAGLRTEAAAREFLRLLDRAASLKPSSFGVKLRGYAYVGSKVRDREALGGYWASAYLPGPVPGYVRVRPGGVRVVARIDDLTGFRGRYRGMRVLVVNAGRERVSFDAQDSRIDLLQEARVEKGEWKPIEYLPSSWCGNSYHRVFLDPGECWTLSAPRYEGVLRARFRLRLDRRGEPPVYSEEFEGSVNPEQFTKEEEH
ncbi:MAG TPA: hypothetical protein VFI25_08015 [Planctomycetota bacterium]|jgi:hypothetical protein|nr:hypothetical protein [Planctomycetota bacterium]